METEKADFTCDLCHETYEKEWSDEEATEEYARDFPLSSHMEEPTSTVCDDCHHTLTSWYLNKAAAVT